MANNLSLGQVPQIINFQLKDGWARFQTTPIFEAGGYSEKKTSNILAESAIASACMEEERARLFFLVPKICINIFIEI